YLRSVVDVAIGGELHAASQHIVFHAPLVELLPCLVGPVDAGARTARGIDHDRVSGGVQRVHALDYVPTRRRAEVIHPLGHAERAVNVEDVIHRAIISANAKSASVSMSMPSYRSIT